jgi:hypothetical protein
MTPQTRDTQTISAGTSELRRWLKHRIESDPRSLHAIEVESGIRGNALGKFLRGERGARHGLTPLMVRRLAPVLKVSEHELLARAGRASYQPSDGPLEAAILDAATLEMESKLLLMSLYQCLRTDPARARAATSSGALPD